MPNACPIFAAPRHSPAAPSRYRGGSGPMRVETCRAANPLYHAFIEAGVTGRPRTCRRSQRFPPGRRSRHTAQRPRRHSLEHVAGLSTRCAAPAQSRRSDRRACHRIAFEASRAVGVERPPRRPRRDRRGGQGDHPCRRSAQLAATPVVIGGRRCRRSASLSIPVVAHLPGVGRGLKDHVAAPVQYRATKNVSAARELTRLVATSLRCNGC